MALLACDLHIHSTLSPCGSLEMSPRNIVTYALAAGLDIIAITDHNMTENSLYVQELGAGQGLVVLPGMELQTLEEIHLLAIFDDYTTAFDFQGAIYGLLPEVQNDPEFFGDQVVVDEGDTIVRSETRLLLNSALISVEDAVSWIKARDGLAIPSHVDSQTNSIIGQLGFVPEHIPFDALEVRHMETVESLTSFVMVRDVPFVTFSDAHYLKDIGRRRTTLDIREPSCKGIADALKRLGRRET